LTDRSVNKVLKRPYLYRGDFMSVEKKMAKAATKGKEPSESKLQDAPTKHERMPSPEEVLSNIEAAPAITGGLNIFPFDWRVETPRLMEIYESSRDPGWSPSQLPWHTLDVESMTLDQRYAVAYWWALLSVFDASGPAVFARAMIHAYEVHEEDAIRKCFLSVTRDEMNHEEVCGRAINKLTPGGPLGYEPQTELGRLARNNIEWLYHNGARYWSGYKKAVEHYPMPILFSSFLFGEVASSTLFHSMYEHTDIPVFKEAFKNIGRDEGRHLSFCLALLKEVLPKLTEEERDTVTKQFRAGFIFLSGILYEPPSEFWHLPPTFLPAQRLLEEKAREVGFGVLSLEQRRENWRTAVVRLKTIVEPHGVKFPALPEIDVDGEDVSFDADKIVPIF
jgi:rubrerythrin